jgi:hypothetical protein
MQKHEETIGHLKLGYSIRSKNEYNIRQDKVCTRLPQYARNQAWKQHSHIAKSVYEHEDITVIRSQGVQTGSGQ